MTDGTAPFLPGPRLDPIREVRLAIVMYGGVSLAIYMNGVAQELLTLVRSTAPQGSGADGATRATPWTQLSGAQRAYRKVAHLIGDDPLPSDENPAPDLRARFVIDVITGSSAGGINGVFLAKAMANNESMESLKKLWVDEGDLARLVNDRRSLQDMPGIRMQDPPQSLLNGTRMYWQLLAAFDLMDEGIGGPPGPSKDVRELDLYVTATDLQGLSLPILLGNGYSFERRYRNVFHFRYERGRADRPGVNDFVSENNPFLAFAARCTSAFPFAFEPMTLSDIGQVLAQFPAYSDAALSDPRTWERFFPDYGARGTSFADRAFGDGGSLDNKPFSYAIEQLGRRKADILVDRKLIFVEPDPTHADIEPDPTGRPDVIKNVVLQGMSLPRQEPIREDIRAVLERNRLIERANRILIALENDWSQWNVLDGHLIVPPSEEEAARLDTTNLIGLLGPSYGSYQRLRVSEATDLIADAVARASGLQDDSDEGLAVGYLIRGWRDVNFYHYRDEGIEGKQPFPRFLADFDLSFARRQIAFAHRRLGALYDPTGATPDRLAKIGVTYLAGGDRDAFDQQILAVRDVLARAMDALDDAEAALMTRGAANPLHAILMDEGVGQPFGAKNIQVLLSLRTDEERRSVCREVASAMAPQFEIIANALREHIRAAKAAAAAVVETEISGLDEGSPDQDDAGRAVRRALRHFYRFFIQYDMAAHPMLSTGALGEADPVEVIRISPEDASSLAKRSGGRPRRKVTGGGYSHFGAFLERLWRENDILWGRLDGAECLIDAMIGRFHPQRDALVAEAQRAIILEELRPKDRDQISALLWKAVVQMPAGTDRETALRTLAGAVAGEPVNPRLDAVLRACLDDDALYQYFRDEYEVDTTPAPGPLLRSASRSFHVVGRILRGVSQNRRLTLLDQPTAWIARIGQLFTGLVEAATPTGLGHLLFRHWLALLYLLEGILVAGGLLLGEPVVQRFGLFALALTLLANLAVLVIGDVMRGASKWRALLRLLLGLVVLAIFALAVLELQHLARDVRVPRGVPWALGLLGHPARSVLPLAIAALVLGAAVTVHGRLWLRTAVAPNPVIDFELAGSKRRAEEIVDSWKARDATLGQARLNFYLDFAFIVAYSAALFVGCLWAAAILGSAWLGFATIGIVLAYGQILAGALDVLEDLTLLRILRVRMRGSLPNDELPEYARWTAQAKFALLTLGLLLVSPGLAKYAVDTGGWALAWLAGSAVVLVYVGVTVRQVFMPRRSPAAPAGRAPVRPDPIPPPAR